MTDDKLSEALRIIERQSLTIEDLCVALEGLIKNFQQRFKFDRDREYDLAKALDRARAVLAKARSSATLHTMGEKK